MRSKKSILISLRSSICTHWRFQQKSNGTTLSPSFSSAAATADTLSTDEVESSQDSSLSSGIKQKSSGTSSAGVKKDSSKSPLTTKTSRVFSSASKSAQNTLNTRADVSKSMTTNSGAHQQESNIISPNVVHIVDVLSDIQKCIAHGWKMGNVLLVISAYEQSRLESGPRP